MKRVAYGPRYVRPNYLTRVRGEHGCACMRDPEMVPGQVEAYLSTRPAGVVDVYYYEHCAHCGGSGRTCTARKRMTWKPCPACNGDAETPETLLASHAGPEYVA